jgi:hypothetical protein
MRSAPAKFGKLIETLTIKALFPVLVFFRFLFLAHRGSAFRIHRHTAIVQFLEHGLLETQTRRNECNEHAGSGSVFPKHTANVYMEVSSRTYATDF